MAREIVYLDDLSGEQGAEPVRIGWNDVWFEVDLAEANRIKLTQFIEEYINAGRPAGRDEAPTPARRTRRPRGESAAAPGGEKTDYTSSEHFGEVHRGRVTEEEMTLVKGNPDQASRNREAQGHPAIDWTDAKECSRYGLTDDDVERMTAAMK